VPRFLVKWRSNSETAVAPRFSHEIDRTHMMNILATLRGEARTAAATFALRRGMV
jgi:hypothetical protein